MKDLIIQFVKKQSCATICCVDEVGNPYCFNCFYVFNDEKGLLYFKSSITTRHSSIILNNHRIAGTILPDKLNVVTIKGIQFEGIILDNNDPLTLHSDIEYYKQNPRALAIPGEIWTIQIEKVKMTDSTLGFGKKIAWNRQFEILE